jgi:hypothetical protein
LVFAIFAGEPLGNFSRSLDGSRGRWLRRSASPAIPWRRSVAHGWYLALAQR